MKVRGHGMAVDAPPGWEVRISRRSPHAAEPGSRPRPVLHASTIALPEVRGDFGGNVTGLLSQDDIFVSLFEHEPAATSTPLFASRKRPVPTPDDFSHAGLQRSIAGQSGRQYFFQEGGRAFCLYVVLGSHARRAALVRTARTVLDSLELTAGGDS